MHVEPAEMRPLLLLLALLTALTWAETPAKVRVLVLTPSLQTGNLDTRTFLRVLEHQVETRFPHVNLVVPHAEDPRLKGLPATGVPSHHEALAAARRFDAAQVVTLRVRFVHRVEGSILTVVGAAELDLDKVNPPGRTSQDPLVFHSAPGGDHGERQTQELIARCARDLAEEIVAHGGLGR